MPGSLQPRVKTWVDDEDVTYSDLNAEFDNVLTAMAPLLIDDYSINVTQMQVTADPGEVGTESVATTLAGELARLRQMIKEITGETQWYTSPSTSLTGLANAIGSGLTDNRLVSGRVRTTSQQPIFLVPHGAARTVTLKGATTNFLYFVEGTQYTIDADVTLTNLTLAPSTNNTCLVNDAVAADQDWTKYQGEDGTEITIDTIGTEISGLVGKLAGFKLDNGSTTEYFIAEVGTNKLIKARRGYFFNSADAPIPRIVYSNNDTITLMKLTWVFAKSDETLTATYNPPTYGKDEPSSPAQGDYWFDTVNNKWKVYGVGSFSDADAMLAGICLQDTSNTIAARSFEFFANYDALNTVEIIYSSVTQVKAQNYGSNINVWGSTIKNEQSIWTWDMTADLESGVTEGASTYYFFYITEQGDKIISDKRPYDRREDLAGWYHPHHSWRCVGSAFNTSGSDLSAVNSYFSRHDSQLILPSQTAAANIELMNRVTPLSSAGGAFTMYLPPAAYWRGQILSFIKTNSEMTAITFEGFGSETINGATTTKLISQYEKLDLMSDGTNIWIMGRYIPEKWTTTTSSVSATVTPGTKGVVSHDSFRWRRVGSSMDIEWDYYQTSASGANSGSGTYILQFPTGTTASTTTHPGQGATTNRHVGFGQFSTVVDDTGGFFIWPYVYDTTGLGIMINDGSGGNWKTSFTSPWTETTFGWAASATYINSLVARVTISEWEYI